MILRSIAAASIALAIGAAASPGPPAAAADRGAAADRWQKGEAYGVLVERGGLSTPASSREFFLFHPVRGLHGGQDLLVLAFDAAAGATTGAFRLGLHDGNHQPSRIEPLDVLLDANNQALRAQPDGETLLCDCEPGAESFSLLTVPLLGGPSWLPYWTPALNGTEPPTAAAGTWIDFGAPETTRRRIQQSWRRDDRGEMIVSIRGADGAALVGNAHFKPNIPLPVFGQILDAERNERIRFRLVFHTSHLVRALSLGRGAIAGDPALIPPELLVEAETVWQPSARDLIADEVIRQIATDRKWGKIEPRAGLPLGELVPFAYELFALQAGVNTGEAPPDPKKKRPAAAPRGMVGLLFAGRFEAPDTGLKYEAWLVPGSDERSQESERPRPTAESTGKLVLRLLLARSGAGMLGGDRSWFVATRAGWFGDARKRGRMPGRDPARGDAAGGAAASRDSAPPRGLDAILVRRENDLAPVLLVFYRLSDDLRSPQIVANLALDGVGPTSVVRRSLLERAKDFFLAGGFTAFTNKKGASVLLTRAADEMTQIDRLEDRGCSLEFLEEKELPEEPWKITMDPRAAKSAWWGSPMAFAVGRNRHGDNRPPRDCVVRRTDGEELLSYEAWEVDRPWWTEAISAYPLQRVGVRFRPLVHTRFESNGTGDGQGENDLLPFLPPPIPPQPNGNPKTAPQPKPQDKEKQKPDPPKKKPTPGPPPPPEPGSTPKTGG